MGDRLPQLKPQQLLRALERLGFLVRRQTGSHIILRHPVSRRIAVVPNHTQDLKRGLLFGILKMADIPPEELLKVL